MASITWVRYPLSVGQQVSTIPVRVRLSDVTVTDLEIAQERSSSGVDLVREGGAVVYRAIDADAHVYDVYVRRSTIYDGRSYVEGELPVGATNAIGVTLRDRVSGVTSETVYISTQPEYPGLTSHVLSEFVDDFEGGEADEPIDRGKWTVTGDTWITVTKSMSIMTISGPPETPGSVLLSGATCLGLPYIGATVYAPQCGSSMQFGLTFLRHDAGEYTVNPLYGASITVDPASRSEVAGVYVRDGYGAVLVAEASISDLIEERGGTYYRVSLAALYDGSRVVLMGGGRVLATVRQNIGGYGASSMWVPFIEAGVANGCIARVGRIAAYGFSGPPSPAMFGVAEQWQLEAASEYFEPTPARAPTAITLNSVYQLTNAGLQAGKRYLLKQIGGYRVSYVCLMAEPTVEECRYGDPLAPDVPVILTPQTNGIHVWACKTVNGTSDATVFLIPLDGGTV